MTHLGRVSARAMLRRMSKPMVLVCLLAWLLVACSAARAKQATDDRPLPARGIEFEYWVNAARPRTDFALRIPPAGDAELELWAPVGSEGRDGPLGHFRMAVDADTRRALERQVRDHDLLDEDPGEWSTAEGSGGVTLATPEKRVKLGLANASTGLQALRTLLDRLILVMVQHPVAAVRARLVAEPRDRGLGPVVELVHVGTEPLDLVFVDGSLVASVVAEVEPVGEARREVALESQRLKAMIANGESSAGMTTLRPGSHIAFPMPVVISPGTRARARVSAWYPGAGRARGSLVLEATAELR